MSPKDHSVNSYVCGIWLIAIPSCSHFNTHCSARNAETCARMQKVFSLKFSYISILMLFYTDPLAPLFQRVISPPRERTVMHRAY